MFKRNIIRSFLVCSLALAALPVPLSAQAQVIKTNEPSATDIFNSTGPLGPVGVGIGMFWPSIDPSFTNAFQKGDLTISAGPLFHSSTATGSSPYSSLAVEWFPSLNVGGGFEVDSFSDGAGGSSVDAASVYLKARKPFANLCLYAVGGVLRDFHVGKFYGRVGAGMEYRYKSGLGWDIGTSLLFDGGNHANQADKTQWLTEVKATYTLGVSARATASASAARAARYYHW
jgi:hypothetical protein